MNMKSDVRMCEFDQLHFSPRFEYGEMAEVTEVCGEGDGTDLGVGWGRFSNAKIPCSQLGNFPMITDCIRAIDR